MTEFSRSIGNKLPLAVLGGALIGSILLGGEAQASPQDPNADKMFMGGSICVGQVFDTDCDGVTNRLDIYPNINDRRVDMTGNGIADWQDRAFARPAITLQPQPASPNVAPMPAAPSANSVDLNKILTDYQLRHKQIPKLFGPTGDTAYPQSSPSYGDTTNQLPDKYDYHKGDADNDGVDNKYEGSLTRNNPYMQPKHDWKDRPDAYWDRQNDPFAD